MIPKHCIEDWRAHAPWKRDILIEQDLVLSRALVEMYSVPEIAERIAFRGGTALHKLHLHSPARYSEDIDLVQIREEAIGETIDLIRAVLDPWLGTPKRTFKHGRIVLIYRFNSEGSPSERMRLKIEINSREHFTVLGHVKVQYSVENPWFSGSANVTTYGINEILGSKFRALYQRKKGRDLFDLDVSLAHEEVNPRTLLHCFGHYMAEGEHAVTRAQFEANLYYKSKLVEFRDGIHGLLRPNALWDFDAGMRLVLDELVALLPGEPWKGEGEEDTIQQ